MLLQSWLPSFKEAHYASLTLCGCIYLVSSVVPKLSLKSFPSHHLTNGQEVTWLSWAFQLAHLSMKYEMLTAEFFLIWKAQLKLLPHLGNNSGFTDAVAYLKGWSALAWEPGNMQLDWARGIYILPSASLNSWILHCSDLALVKPASLSHCYLVC